MMKLCKDTVVNNGPAYLLSNACIQKIKKNESLASMLTFTLFCIAYCELLLKNLRNKTTDLNL